MINLFTSQISDSYIRQNFQKLLIFFKLPTFSLLHFKHLEFQLTQSGTVKVPHNLGFTPKDVLVTSQTGTPSISFVYDQFDSTYLVLSVGAGASKSSPVTVRAYVGTHSEDGL